MIKQKLLPHHKRGDLHRLQLKSVAQSHLLQRFSHQHLLVLSFDDHNYWHSTDLAFAFALDRINIALKIPCGNLTKCASLTDVAGGLLGMLRNV